MMRLGLAALFWLGCSGSEGCPGKPVTLPSPQPPPDHEAVARRAATSSAASPASSPASSPAEAEQASNRLQRVLDCFIMDKRVLPYFHVDTQPGRKPLIIQKNDIFKNEPALKMFGIPVGYLAKEQNSEKKVPYLDISTLLFKAEEAELTFAYPIEGISGWARLVVSAGGCEVKELRLRER